MLEGFGLGCVQKPPLTLHHVAPRNDTDVDGCGDCFSRNKQDVIQDHNAFQLMAFTKESERSDHVRTSGCFTTTVAKTSSL
jgi:hypothetical protein